MIDPTTRIAALVFDGLSGAALEQSNQRWSGPEMRHEVEVLSVVLRRLGVGAGTRVALRLPIGHDYVIGLLASFNCGASVVPTDPADEWAWTTSVQLCGPRVAVTTSGCALVKTQTVTAIPGEAWLLPTSGSTGAPRMVVGSAQGLIERLNWGREWFAASDTERCGVLSPGTFIDALTHSLQTLAAGRVLVLPPLNRDTHGGWLRPFLTTSGLDQLVSVPSVLPPLVSDAEFHLPELTRWVLSGELLRARSVELARRIAPHAEVLNSYGSTETTGDISVSSWSPGDNVPDPVPVGHVQSTIPWRLEPRSDGTQTLRCGGQQIALSILGDEDAITTEDRTRWYDTGDTAVKDKSGITITGRFGGTNGFAKVRGKRLDLALVESGLESLPTVREAMAIVRTGLIGSQLVGLVAADQPLPTWRVDLRGRMPESHVPDRVVAVQGLPRTSSGKIDRAEALRISRVAPGSGTEFVDAVASVAAEALGDGVPPDEALIDAGLDSLSAVALAVALEEAFGVPCTPEDLFREGSLAAVASFLLAKPIEDERSVRCLRAARTTTRLPARIPNGLSALSPATPFPVLVLFPPAVGTSLGYVRLVARLRFAGQIDAIEISASGQEALDDDGQEALARLYADQIEKRHPTAPVICLGWSFGAAIAIRCQLELARREIATPHVVLLDPALLNTAASLDVEAWARSRLWEDGDYSGPPPSSNKAFVREARAGGRLAQVHPKRIEQWLRTLAAARRASAEGFSSPPTTSVTVIRAHSDPRLTYPPWLSDPDPRMAVIDIDSTHFNLLRGDALPAVASLIDAALECVIRKVIA